MALRAEHPISTQLVFLSVKRFSVKTLPDFESKFDFSARGLKVRELCTSLGSHPFIHWRTHEVSVCESLRIGLRPAGNVRTCPRHRYQFLTWQQHRWS